MLWERIQGQEAAVNFLRQSLKKQRSVHAYLFEGPPGVGKGTTARMVAQALNCEADGSPPCGACGSCRSIERGTHPDVFWIKPLGKSRSIGIDQVRDLERMAHFNAQLGRWKVMVIEEADAMRDPAANALLKTLEEPPPRTMFILLSSRAEKLLPTIRSRCQTVRFQPWPFDLMEPFLRERSGLTRDQAWVLHCLTGGRPGRALKMTAEGFFRTRALIVEVLEKGGSSSGRELMETAVAWLDHLDERNAAREAELKRSLPPQVSPGGPDSDEAEEEQNAARLAAARRADLEMVFELIFGWLRDLYVAGQTGLEVGIINQDRLPAVRRQSRRYSRRELLRMMAGVERCREAAQVGGAGRSAYQLIFEYLLLQLGFWKPPEKPQPNPNRV